MKIHPIAALLLAILPLSSHAAEIERIPYTCDNGSRIEISFASGSDEQPQATLHFADEAINLRQVPVTTGALYRNETIRLHTQDEKAVFEDGKGNVRRCQRGTVAEQSSAVAHAPASSSFIDLSGQASYRSRQALPPDSQLVIRIQDTGRAGAPALTLAEQRIALSGQSVPIAFQTTIDRDLVGKKARITVIAHIERRGKLLFISDRGAPKLENGQASPLDLKLKAVGRAGR
ncbi:MAG: hypothetical protein D3M94_16395 [Rhodocyclales bacterium GT-UBC]|nr:MAG: hypothetical protein D3M94_16395 [Rhodocyclales bacterium GT-UBC]